MANRKTREELDAEMSRLPAPGLAEESREAGPKTAAKTSAKAKKKSADKRGGTAGVPSAG